MPPKERKISNQEFNSHLNTESWKPLIKTCTNPSLSQGTIKILYPLNTLNVQEK